MKKGVFLLLLAASLGLTGCALDGGMPDLTEEETVLISEYAAGIALKYDRNYSGGLLGTIDYYRAERDEEKRLERQQMAKEAVMNYNNQKGIEQSTPEADNTQNQDTAGDNQGNGNTEVQNNENPNMGVESTLSFLGKNDFGLTYNGYELVSSYPEGDSFMQVEAEAGKKLCILKFSATNNAGEAKELDIFGAGAKFSATVDGKKYRVSSTLLENDLSSYMDNFESGETRDMVLILEVEDTVENPGGIVLNIDYNGNSGSALLN